MRLETFALERFQSIWENRVAWNVSESGVHPLRVSELSESPHDGRPPGPGTRLSADQRHRRAAAIDRRDVSGGDAGPRPGHQRRIRSQLHPPDAARRARRRDRVPDAELHAGVGPARGLGATVRPWRLRAQTRRTTRSGDGRRSRRAESARHAARRARSCSAIPTIRPARGSTGATLDEICRIAVSRRRVGGRRRDLSRRGARGGRYADRVGTLRACHRHERAVEGATACPGSASAGSSRRPISSPTSGRSTTTRRSRPAGSTTGSRGSRSSRRGARSLLARTRGIIRANYPIVRALDRAAGRAQPHRAGGGGHRRSSATRTRSDRPS